MIQDPVVLSNLFDNKEFNNLKLLFTDYKNFEFQSGFSRYVIADNIKIELKEYSKALIPKAREVFNSQTLLPTYTLFSHYEGENPAPSLYKHVDDNACTYTLDLCLYQNKPWELWVENKSYTLYPNQALAYYGNDQMHWREDFPDPKNQHVAMVFFHFAEPDHWYFTKGPNYLYTHIRNK